MLVAWTDYGPSGRTPVQNSFLVPGQPYGPGVVAVYRKYGRSTRLRNLPHRQRSQRLVAERQTAFETEKAAARLILKAQQQGHGLSNVAHVYAVVDPLGVGVEPPYIDYELLDMSASPQSRPVGEIKEAIKAAFAQLHRLGIVYFDLQFHNLGYSPVTQQWKLFDFDAVGIARLPDLSAWAIPPQDWARKRQVDDTCREMSENANAYLARLCSSPQLSRYDDITLFLFERRGDLPFSRLSATSTALE